MNILNMNSLALTLHSLNDRILRQENITDPEKAEIALWISSLQGQPGSYRGMFATGADDKENEATVFTGEILDSNASLRHILGDEALYALLWLDIREKPVQTAIFNAYRIFAEFTQLQSVNPPSMFCCGKCTDAVLRVMKMIPEPEAKRYIQSSLKAIKAHRDGNGKWKRFPFFYTLYALMDMAGAEEELAYALPVLKRSMKMMKPTDIIKERKQMIGEKILTRLS